MNVSSKIRDLISPLVDDMNEDQYAQPYGAPSESLGSHVIHLTMNEERTRNTC